MIAGAECNHIRNLGWIRNSLFHNKYISKLQRVQNCLASGDQIKTARVGRSVSMLKQLN